MKRYHPVGKPCIFGVPPGFGHHQLAQSRWETSWRGWVIHPFPAWASEVLMILMITLLGGWNQGNLHDFRGFKNVNHRMFGWNVFNHRFSRSVSTKSRTAGFSMFDAKNYGWLLVLVLSLLCKTFYHHRYRLLVFIIIIKIIIMQKCLPSVLCKSKLSFTITGI